MLEGIGIEAAVLLAVAVFGFLLYRCLIRSKWFSRLVGGTKPLPETSAEVIDRLDAAECAARDRAVQAESDALTNREVARTIRRRAPHKKVETELKDVTERDLGDGRREYTFRRGPKSET